MARVEAGDAWDAAGDAKSLHRKLLRFFRQQKMTVVAEEEGEFHSLRATQGSQLWTRLLGGWFVSPATLPKRALATFTETRKGLRLRVTIEETLGFGILDPLLEKKYASYFEEWLADLEEFLDLARDRDRPDESRPRSERRSGPAPNEKRVTRRDDRLAPGDES
jgi:hypothetical protein